jgi:hypothetical protein
VTDAYTALLSQAAAASAAVAAVVLLIFGRPWGAPDPRRVAVGWALGVGSAWLLGCWLLDVRPGWPPREDKDRFLGLLLPATVLVELMATVGKAPRVAWLLRLGIAAGAVRLLLHNTSYLADLAGPGTREWSAAQMWFWTGVPAAALAAVWAALALLTRRAPGRSVPLALALACAGAGVTVMYSGYATGGQIGLPLAAALIGASTGSLALPRTVYSTFSPGVGVVGLFGVLVVGRFFGALTTAHAALLLSAPLLCWLPELPPIRKLPPWARGILRVVLVAVPVSCAVLQAQQASEAASPAPFDPGDL